MKRITINDIAIEFDDAVSLEFDGKTLRIAGASKVVENHFHTHMHPDGFQAPPMPIERPYIGWGNCTQIPSPWQMNGYEIVSSDGHDVTVKRVS